jgi:hypothetical protein
MKFRLLDIAVNKETFRKLETFFHYAILAVHIASPQLP